MLYLKTNPDFNSEPIALKNESEIRKYLLEMGIDVYLAALLATHFTPYLYRTDATVNMFIATRFTAAGNFYCETPDVVAHTKLVMIFKQLEEVGLAIMEDPTEKDNVYGVKAMVYLTKPGVEQAERLRDFMSLQTSTYIF